MHPQFPIPNHQSPPRESAAPRPSRARPFRIPHSAFRISPPASRPSRAPLSAFSIHRSAFTLIELMVVVGIIVILAAVTVPAVKALTQGNSQKQAVNLLSALLNNARAIAITSHQPAGLVVYEDPSNKSQTSGQLLICSSIASVGGVSTMSFTRPPLTGPQSLPAGVKVGTLGSTANTFNISEETSTPTPSLRFIAFDENGQLMLRSNLQIDTTTITVATDPSAAAWNFNTTAANNTTSPGFIVYDASELQAAVSTGKVSLTTASSIYTWMQQHADLIILNAYTGNVIR